MRHRRIITERGRMLWLDLAGATAYAEARFTLYGTRQQVRVVIHNGERTWHVRTSNRTVAEPCS